MILRCWSEARCGAALMVSFGQQPIYRKLTKTQFSKTISNDQQMPPIFFWYYGVSGRQY